MISWRRRLSPENKEWIYNDPSALPVSAAKIVNYSLTRVSHSQFQKKGEPKMVRRPK
jgi:hypothetical protein